MPEKTCSICQIKMQPGRLLNNGLVWSGKVDKEREVYEKCVKGCEALPAYGVRAYRCPNCNKVDLYTDEAEKA